MIRIIRVVNHACPRIGEEIARIVEPACAASAPIRGERAKHLSIAGRGARFGAG